MSKTVKKQPKPRNSQTRRLKIPQYKSFRLSKPLKSTQPRVPSATKIFRSSFSILKSQWRFFLGVALIYGLFTIFFVSGGGSGLNVTELKEVFDESIETGVLGSLTSSLAIFGVLLSSSAAVNTEVGLLYQFFILLVVSLAVVWGLREMQASNRPVSVKDAFYQGMYPLIPVLLVLFVVGLQLLPASIGATIYTATIAGGIAVTAIEQVAWIFFVLLLFLLSFYMVASSVFALYIVTLPNMTPLRALRSARQLVLHRRWVIMRKLLYLFIALLLITGLVIVPLIAFVPLLAQALFFACSLAVIPFVHTFMYSLYRSLL